MTNQIGNSIAINTRIKRAVYDELASHIDNQNNTISSVASLAIEYGLQVMKKTKAAINEIAEEKPNK